MKLYMYPYNMGSDSAKKIAQALEIVRVFPDGKYKSKEGHAIINWGNSSLPSWHKADTKYLNHPTHVGNVTNKLRCFNILQRAGIAIPKYFSSKRDVIHYTEGLSEFPIIYCRTKLSGHSGEGIVLANSVSELVDAPLYTVYFNARKEWRVHVCNGKVIDFAKKAYKNNERPDRLIRNVANGWIFRRGGLELPDYLAKESIKAIEACGLDFGAVDIAEDREGNMCVYEINSACGVGGDTTLENYVRAFNEY
jgi:glutathione synthase/RimK-type ligase-like ATP-grasp enzyme